jgi:16S rRNA (guanine527-N7)-methyltransferase
MPIPDFVKDDLSRLGIEVPPEMLGQLGVYLDHLLTVNQQMNLTAIREPEAAWRKLIIDSLTLLPVLADVAEDAAVIDVGSGGGLPGIPVAITRPDVAVTLLEATGKKANFLGDCAGQLKLANVKVINDRAEKVGQDKAHRQKYDVCICRGVGPMAELLEYTLPLVKVGGLLLAMKGPKVEEEMEKAGDALLVLGGGEIEIIDAYPECFGISTVIVRVIKAQPTPREYPRAPGMPRQFPI